MITRCCASPPERSDRPQSRAAQAAPGCNFSPAIVLFGYLQISVTSLFVLSLTSHSVIGILTFKSRTERVRRNSQAACHRLQGRSGLCHFRPGLFVIDFALPVLIGEEQELMGADNSG